MKNYSQERDEKIIKQIKELRDRLPEFCSQFFVAMSNITSPLTRLNYGRDYLVFFNYLTNEVRKFKNTSIEDFTIDQLNAVTQTDIENYLDYLTSYVDENGITRNNGAEGKSRKLASLRRLFAYLYNKNLLRENVSTKVDMPKKHSKEIIRLEGEEMTDFLDVVEGGEELSSRAQKYHEKTKIRDVALLTLMLGTGIRVSECVGLNIEDVDLAAGSFRVTRKGGNRTILYLPEEVIEIMEEYMEYRRSLEVETTALFLSMQNKRIGVRTVEIMVKKYAEIATPLKHITPHKLRSTFGTNLYRETKDIYVVAEVLGHTSIETTKRHYAAIDEDIKRQAAGVVKIRKKEDEEDG
ncbi:MAG: tyrosine-type recombinase/integrase [Clostridia bacterium]|nr:tyrosine-type recombinase/integrase [Clostridia bacterium]